MKYSHSFSSPMLGFILPTEYTHQSISTFTPVATPHSFPWPTATQRSQLKCSHESCQVNYFFLEHKLPLNHMWFWRFLFRTFWLPEPCKQYKHASLWLLSPLGPLSLIYIRHLPFMPRQRSASQTYNHCLTSSSYISHYKNALRNNRILLAESSNKD